MRWSAALVPTLALILASLPAAADFEAGFIRFEQGDFAGALEELEPLAKQGEARSQYIVGVMTLNGWTGEPDAAAAADWFRKAAEQGYVEAQVELARLYRDGEGVDQDLGAMVEWYQKAASLGHVGAQLLVADAYAYGHGVAQDRVKAYMWYEIAIRYWGHLAQHARDVIGEQMTQEEIAEAQRLAARTLPEQEGGAAQ